MDDGQQVIDAHHEQLERRVEEVGADLQRREQVRLEIAEEVTRLVECVRGPLARVRDRRRRIALLGRRLADDVDHRGRQRGRGTGRAAERRCGHRLGPLEQVARRYGRALHEESEQVIAPLVAAGHAPQCARVQATVDRIERRVRRTGDARARRRDRHVRLVREDRVGEHVQAARLAVAVAERGHGREDGRRDADVVARRRGLRLDALRRDATGRDEVVRHRADGIGIGAGQVGQVLVRVQLAVSKHAVLPAELATALAARVRRALVVRAEVSGKVLRQ